MNEQAIREAAGRIAAVESGNKTQLQVYGQHRLDGVVVSFMHDVIAMKEYGMQQLASREQQACPACHGQSHPGDGHGGRDRCRGECIVSSEQQAEELATRISDACADEIDESDFASANLGTAVYGLALDILKDSREQQTADDATPERAAEVAHRLSQVVRELCSDVPHDIGLTLVMQLLALGVELNETEGR